MSVKVLLTDNEVPLEKVEELLLHEVDLSQAEAEALVTLDSSVASPVLVLGGRVVERLCGEDKRSEEDAVDSAAHALGDRWEPLLETAEVDKGSHESWNLDG